MKDWGLMVGTKPKKGWHCCCCGFDNHGNNKACGWCSEKNPSLKALPKVGSRGKITKILDVKYARGRDKTSHARKYIRLTFKMDDGSWAKTDICPEYRNYRVWKRIIRAGVDTVLIGLEYTQGRKLSKVEIDADSPAMIDPDQSFDLGEQAEIERERDAQPSLFPDLKQKINNLGDMG